MQLIKIQSRKPWDNGKYFSVKYSLIVLLGLHFSLTIGNKALIDIYSKSKLCKGFLTS